jgi:hypothetical protein
LAQPCEFAFCGDSCAHVRHISNRSAESAVLWRLSPHWQLPGRAVKTLAPETSAVRRILNGTERRFPQRWPFGAPPAARTAASDVNTTWTLTGEMWPCDVDPSDHIDMTPWWAFTILDAHQHEGWQPCLCRLAATSYLRESARDY